MSYVDLNDHLERIAGNDGKDREAVSVRVAITDHPELRGYRHFTGEVLLISPQINVFCDNVLIERHGNQFVALPFTVDKTTRLYSSPVIFYVGLQNENGFGIIPYAGWETHFEEAGIDPKIVRKIRTFLLQHCPVNYL